MCQNSDTLKIVEEWTRERVWTCRGHVVLMRVPTFQVPDPFCDFLEMCGTLMNSNVTFYPLIDLFQV